VLDGTKVFITNGTWAKVAARLLVWRVADLIDRGQPFDKEARCC
jgi:alkylation response protein AidB-like acyl-CoA dehydrogenase